MSILINEVSVINILFDITLYLVGYVYTHGDVDQIHMLLY